MGDGEMGDGDGMVVQIDHRPVSPTRYVCNVRVCVCGCEHPSGSAGHLIQNAVVFLLRLPRSFLISCRAEICNGGWGGMGWGGGMVEWVLVWSMVGVGSGQDCCSW